MGKPQSDTGGVKAFPVEGPFKTERARLAGMTDADRAFRKQWLKDQILSESEPVVVPEHYKERFNPIRRFYRWPLDTLFRPLVPLLGYESAAKYRWFAGRFGLIFGAAYATFYYFKYNQNDWTSKAGWRVLTSKPLVTPASEEFPFVSPRSEGADYAARGFKSSPI